MFKCAEYSSSLGKILIFCDTNDINISQVCINALVENRNYIPHIQKSLDLLDSNLSLPVKQTIFDQMCNFPQEAKIIVYRNAKNLVNKTKNDFRNHYKNANVLRLMWSNWSEKNSEGQEVTQPPAKIMEKILFESSNGEIDEVTNSAISDKYFLKRFQL